MHPRLSIVGIIIATWSGFGSTFADAAPSRGTESHPDFATEIQPLLASRCFPCHGPDEATREAGLRLDTFEGATAARRGRAAIMPGRPEESLVLARVTHADPDLHMPPPGTGASLNDAEVDALRRWIASGAEYTPHWAFEPPTLRLSVAARELANDPWVRNFIDVHTLAGMQSASLTPEAEADRATLIRRVALDLTGLPPTLEQTDAFLNDSEPDAYERMVDRMLASPHYGERWAQPWLDAARYADTKGYEADRRRVIWPWRDWVIRALNEDMPFDQFTVEQLAGDLLPEPTLSQQVATAFHRNTMTNDEGGTDNEEFRIAAVIDRVNTTMQTWMGMTMACAQCHTHKYDPITHEEYYQFLAFFNTTQDNDEMDDRPLLTVPGPSQQAQLADAQAAVDAADDALRRRTAALAAELADVPGPPPSPIVLWINNAIPAGAQPTGPDGTPNWPWFERASDSRVTRIDARGRGTQQAFFTGARHRLTLSEHDVLRARVRVDADHPPRAIMLQWHTIDGNWNHRAFWGENIINFGPDSAPSRVHQGPVPDGGQWIELTVPASALGLAGTTINGVATTIHDGIAEWDAIGVEFDEPHDARWMYNFEAWIAAVNEKRVEAPERIAALAGTYAQSNKDGDRIALMHHFISDVSLPARDRIAAERDALATARASLNAASASIPKIPVLREQAPEQQRETFIFAGGSFLNPTDQVSADVPDIFPQLPEGPRTRLQLAHWLTSRDNPLTARVQVNRVWELIFGTGLVDTPEDFGIQGAKPSHPDLLDALAIEFMERGWSQKELLRTILCSATYRQSSTCDASKREADPYNRLLARGPRTRLDAEIIRDQALASAGLLNRTMFGPPVFPPQPDGVWQMVYSNDRWTTSEDDNRFRRSIYTFWRRTSPYPSMTTFDAPSREFCVTQRIRTNTPLQALVTLNDPVYIEAAGALAQRMMAASSEREGLTLGFRRCVIRVPQPEELDTMEALLESERSHFQANPDDARALVTSARLDPDAMNPSDAAAWIVTANVLLNLDEVLVRR